MKRLFYLMILVFFFIIPINTYAIKISGTSIAGDKERKPKEEVSLDFTINFKDIEKGLDKTLGIWYINFELVYDTEVLEVKGVSSNDFDVDVLKSSDSKYYVFGEVIDNENSDKYCAEGMLYCSDYTVTVKFTLKNTKENSTTVKMNNIEVGLLDMVEAREYTEEDAMVITTPDIATHKITITQPKTSNKNTNKNTNTNTTVSRNLSSLEIEGYDLEFKKDETDYVVYVEKDTNSVIVNAKTEDSKATYEVVGADDLKKSNHQVKVVVTATDKTKQTYYIKIKEKKEETEKIEKPLKRKKKTKSVDSENIIKWLKIGGGILVVIIIILLIISKIRDHSIDKKLKKLDE